MNKSKEKLGNFSKSFSKNKSDEEAPKQKILSPKEIRERAQKIAKNDLDEDENLTA
ncbi:hypothetical protein MLS218_10530 [Helicobacter pylori]